MNLRLVQMVEEANGSCGLKQTSEFGSLTSLQVSVATHGNLVDDIAMADYKKPFFIFTTVMNQRPHKCWALPLCYTHCQEEE